jgi:hypothetical protein
VRIERHALKDVPPAAYDRLIGSSFFASRGFVELWSARGGRPVVWTATRDGAIAAILPGVEFGVWPLRRFTSMPDGCYGGVFTDPAFGPERDALAAELLGAIDRGRYARIHVFDFSGTLPSHPGFRMTTGVTTLVDIGAPDWHPPDAELCAQIRKAERDGTRIERFDAARHLTRFLALSSATDRRHGIGPRYSREFYRGLAALAGRDPRVLWRWCERDGRAACSHIYFVERGVLQAWQSCFDKEYSFMKPNAYLRYTLCREMAKLGVTRLNLGGTPASATGLARFKARWGGVRIEFGVAVRQTRLAAAADRGRVRPSAGRELLTPVRVAR